MDEDHLQSRLSRISTVWTLVAASGQEAHVGETDPRLALIQRYQGAAYRYLLAAVRDPETADELFQEFALRVVQGRFTRAQPTKGRFRDYLKSSLVHLVMDFRRRQCKTRSEANPALSDVAYSDGAAIDLDAPFMDSMRDELLARAWAHLEQIQKCGGPCHYSVLRLRAEQPAMTSLEMASQLNAQLHVRNPFTETSVRKSLQRARAAFADFLVSDVAHSLGRPSREELEQELMELGLHAYCAPALARRGATG